MTVAGIASRCWILALVERDDGERILLGDGEYDFVDSQQHFSANVMENDIIEIQGNDGVLLAGQVRRASAQDFDGYIGDATTPKAKIEQLRRKFFAFFIKDHYYRVIYISSDGTATQRQRGFIVDAPEVKELYQLHPRYHVSLNFEDVNYYSYAESADGKEIFNKSASVGISVVSHGGLMWADGTNLAAFNPQNGSGITVSYDSATGEVAFAGTATAAWVRIGRGVSVNYKAGTYTFSIQEPKDYAVSARLYTDSASYIGVTIAAGSTSATVTVDSPIVSLMFYVQLTSGSTYDESLYLQLETGDEATEFSLNGAAGIVWDNIGAVWETGGGGATTISLDSISSVYPAWTVRGLVVNPTITNITTGTTLSYYGTITESQVLKIDMNRQTATLNGANVIGNVVGDWIDMSPGNNQIVYSADNSAAPNSTIEWQEVVG